MNTIKIDVKTGFKCDDLNPIFIYTDKGDLFYTSSILKNFKGRFNLPKGIYKTPNNLTILKNPIEYKVTLPKPERNYFDNIDTAKILFDENPNKCTIFHNKNIILFDNSFKNKSEIVLKTIIEHERGHKKYFTEWKADLFAFSRMLDMGYNPSQIKAVFLTILSKNRRNLIRMYKYFKTL